MAAKPQLTLAEMWLQSIGDGRLSVQDATEWAAARVAEGAADEIMHTLSRCHGTHAERDLHLWAGTQPWRGVIPQPYTFACPKTRLGRRVQERHHCILPHELFSQLAHKVPSVFEQLFGTPSDREDFWKEMLRTLDEMPEGDRKSEHGRWLQSDPTAARFTARQRIPMGMHGDAGEMQGGEKVMVVSWGGLCLRGSTLDTRLLFTCLKHSDQVHQGHETLYRCFTVLAWSFQAMAEGLHPASDEEGVAFSASHHPERAALAGKPLVPAGLPVSLDGNLCGSWCELRGDWQFLREALNLKYHWGGKDGRICHLCAATDTAGRHSFRDFAMDGPLCETLVGPRPQGERAWETLDPASPLCNLPNFSIWRCMFDLMHTLELGLLQRVIPAALQGLLGLRVGSGPAQETSVFAGTSKAAKCKAAFAAYAEWAASTGVPHSSRVKAITPRWVEGAYPHISQSHAKAAPLRAMLPWVAALAEKRAEVSEAARLRAACLRGLADLDGVYTRQARFLTRAQEQAAMDHAEVALRSLARLEERFPNGPWRCIPKAHALLHLVRDSAMGNPRVSHCYQDEDFVGRSKKIYSSCHGRTAPRRSLERYGLALSITLTAREELSMGTRRSLAPRPAGGPLRQRGRIPEGASASTAAAPSAGKRARGRPPLPRGPSRSVGRPSKRGRPA